MVVPGCEHAPRAAAEPLWLEPTRNHWGEHGGRIGIPPPTLPAAAATPAESLRARVNGTYRPPAIAEDDPMRLLGSALRLFREQGMFILNSSAFAAPVTQRCLRAVLDTWGRLDTALDARGIQRSVDYHFKEVVSRGWARHDLRTTSSIRKACAELFPSSASGVPVREQNAPLFPLFDKLLRTLLGSSYRMIYSGVVVTEPGADWQSWHRDGGHLDNRGRVIRSAMRDSKTGLPPSPVIAPHAVDIFIPLVDLNDELGPTEFIPTSQGNPDDSMYRRMPSSQRRTRQRGVGGGEGQVVTQVAAEKRAILTYEYPWQVPHLRKEEQGGARKRPPVGDFCPGVSIAPHLRAGTAAFFDFRLLHRGRPNRSRPPPLPRPAAAGNVVRDESKLRPIIYLTFAKPWFQDKVNRWSLGPLLDFYQADLG